MHFIQLLFFVILFLLGHGDQRDVPAEDGQGCGGRGHSRHQSTGGHDRVHQTGTGGEDVHLARVKRTTSVSQRIIGTWLMFNYPTKKSFINAEN